MKNYKKITLTEKEMPTNWYNIVADMANKPLPHLNPATKQPGKKGRFLSHFCPRTCRAGIFPGTIY